jgi:hypothetical protein
MRQAERIALKMEAILSSNPSDEFNQNTRRYILHDTIPKTGTDPRLF